MKIAVNLSPQIGAAIRAKSKESGSTSSAIVRAALAEHFGIRDNYKRLVKWRPSPRDLADEIPSGANI